MFYHRLTIQLMFYSFRWNWYEQLSLAILEASSSWWFRSLSKITILMFNFLNATSSIETFRNTKGE